ncbi:MAG: Na+/H+ antiporter subunit E [Ignisphaera sp.]|uniref:Cation:proton antiporter n=1 Tax=Ignisphaera aggregans TaxID=334771 RepID=A0A7C4D0K2_9CREN
MRRILKTIPATLLAFVTYIVFSGSITLYDILTGIAVSIPIGVITANMLLTNPLKILDIKRWVWLFAYMLHYFFIDEVKAHIDVIKRIIHPKMPINPGIVKVPINVSTDYALTAVANSITNTPGTVVVDVDKEKGYLYIHWIDVKTIEPNEAWKQISQVFEKFAKKVFD